MTSAVYTGGAVQWCFTEHCSRITLTRSSCRQNSHFLFSCLCLHRSRFARVPSVSYSLSLLLSCLILLLYAFWVTRSPFLMFVYVCTLCSSSSLVNSVLLFDLSKIICGVRTLKFFVLLTSCLSTSTFKLASCRYFTL